MTIFSVGLQPALVTSLFRWQTSSNWIHYSLINYAAFIQRKKRLQSEVVTLNSTCVAVYQNINPRSMHFHLLWEFLVITSPLLSQLNSTPRPEKLKEEVWNTPVPADRIYTSYQKYWKPHLMLSTSLPQPKYSTSLLLPSWTQQEFGE